MASTASDRKLCDFPPATPAAWRELAARELKGAPLERLTSRTPEGIEVPPLSTAGAVGGDAPREVLTARPGRAWTICQEYRQVRPRDAGAAAAEDLSQGAEAAWFVVDEAIAAGVDGLAGRVGVALGGAEDLAAMLAGVDLARAPVTIDAGLRALPVAALLAAEAARRGAPASRLRGLVGGDPLALLAAVGELGWSVEHAYQDMAELTAWARARAPGLRTVLVDATPWHEAGATAADELAAGLAAALEHLRALERRGIAAAAAAEGCVFVFAVGRDLLLELAKLRAARLVWARLAAACGAGPEGQVMRLHARASRRELSGLDPWVNLIRTTNEGVAAALGGADTIAVAALDEALGEPGPLGRRMARNIQLLLREESHLGAVRDPAGGSYTIEASTEALAREAWRRLQAIEAEGGLLASLRAGAIQGRVAAAAAAQEKAVASLRLPIVGASRFAAADERGTGAVAAERAAAVAAARAQGTGAEGQAGADGPRGAGAEGQAGRADVSQGPGSEGQVLGDSVPAAGARGVAGFARPGPGERVTPLVRERLAAAFERLRATAAERARQGRPLKVALVPVGAAAAVRPRVEFSRTYFPVGGFGVVEGEATEDLEAAARQFAASGAQAAVICGTDASYPALVPALVPRLRAAGARAVVLAGRPKDQVEALTAAGVDLFISLGGDALEVLGALQRRLEVQP